MLIKTGIVILCLYFGFKIAKALIKKKLKKMLFPDGMPDGMSEEMRKKMQEGMFGGVGGNMGSPENPENPAEKEADLTQCAACETWIPTPAKYMKKGQPFCSKECLAKGPKES